MDQGGWDEDGRTGWEPDNESKIPQDQMAAVVCVKSAERRDGAPAPGQVGEVDMERGHGTPEIECASSENTAHKVPAHARLPDGEEGHLSLIEGKKQGRPQHKEH